jgi:hypothetical protein
VVPTNHYSLKYLLDQRLSTIPQHAWVSKLFGFQFSVEFKPGHQKVVADALSHWDEEAPAVTAISVPNFELFDQFRREGSTQQEIVAKREETAADTADKPWLIVDDIVVHDGQVFTPVTSTLWPTILEHTHGVGHEGVQKTLQRLRSSYTPQDAKLVREFIRGYSVCQHNKTEHLHSVGLLQPLSVPTVV